MASKGSGKNHTIYYIYSELQKRHPEFISDILLGDKFCYDILKIDDTDVPMNLVKILLDCYSLDDEVFVCNNLKLFITLEDVLFIAGLPVEGKLIANASKNTTAFKDVFNLPLVKSQCSIEKIKDIVLNDETSREDRKKALWLIMMTCFIVPSGDGHRVKADYVAYVNDLNEVTSYCWGVALLSYLHCGIKKWKNLNKPKASIDGNLWILLAFFLIRMPKLVSLLNLDVDDSQVRVPLVLKYVTALKKIAKNRKFKYDRVQSYLANVTTDEVNWTPYAGLQLPDNLKGQEKFGLLLGPLCFMENLVYHQPQCTPDQFPELQEVQLENLTWVKRPLPCKKNSGQFAQNFEVIYKDVLKDWDKKMVTDFLPKSEEERDVPSDKSESIQTPQEDEDDFLENDQRERDYTYQAREGSESEEERDVPSDKSESIQTPQEDEDDFLENDQRERDYTYQAREGSEHHPSSDEEIDMSATLATWIKQVKGSESIQTPQEDEGDSLENDQRERVDTYQEREGSEHHPSTNEEMDISVTTRKADKPAITYSRRGSKRQGSKIEESDVKKTRTQRKVNTLFNHSNYVTGYNLGYWRKKINKPLVNKLCKFMDSLDSKDTTTIIESSNNYATRIDCGFYEGRPCQ